jgi:iron complex transport system substrate-binding protein
MTTAPSPLPTVVSLAPAATDIVAALGRGASLLAVSHECDHREIAGLPVVTSSAIAAAGLDTDVDPAHTDQLVTDALAAGDALYRTDLAAIAALAPAVVVGQDICDVCAVSARSVTGLLPAGTTLVTLGATTIDGLAHDIDAVAAALGAVEEGRALVESITARLDAVAAARSGPPRTVVTLEWGDPPFIAGHWVPELVELAGGRDLLGEAGRPSRRIDPGEIVAADPELILYVPCGYLLDVAVAEARRVFGTSPLADRVVVGDAGRLFSRCTPVVADAVEALAEVFTGGLPAGFARL